MRSVRRVAKERVDRVSGSSTTDSRGWKRLLLLVAMIMVATVILAACGDDDDADPTATTAAAAPTTASESSPATGGGEAADDYDAVEFDYGSLSGSIAIDGSSTVFPVTQAVAEEFNAEASDVQITVGVSGTGGGFKKFCAGETVISDASRPIKDEEAALCEEEGIEYTELSVAFDGLSVVVNPENDWAACMTVDQLKAIWEPGSTVQNWSDIDASWPDEKINLYGPGTDSGTFDYFTDEIVGEEGASRSDYSASEDDNVLVQGVSGDEYALGYFGFAYYEENADALQLVAVDGGNGCVEPSRETVESGEYAPLSRPIFIYVNNAAMADEQVAAFVHYYLSEAGVAVVPEVGYINLDEATLQAQRDKVLGLLN